MRYFWHSRQRDQLVGYTLIDTLAFQNILIINVGKIEGIALLQSPPLK
jgi:hypothetical protein